MSGVTWAGFLGLLLASVVIIAVPGPSVLYLVGQAVAGGRRIGLLSVVGNALGMAVVALIIAVGLSELIAHVPWALLALRWVGAVVLALIGLSYLRGQRHADDDQVRPRSAGRTFNAAIVVGVTNPKALVMFGVIVPGFLTATSSNPVASLLVLSAVPLGVGLVLDSAWVLLASAARRWLAASPRRVIVMERVGGSLIIALAVALALGA